MKVVYQDVESKEIGEEVGSEEVVEGVYSEVVSEPLPKTPRTFTISEAKDFLGITDTACYNFLKSGEWTATEEVRGRRTVKVVSEALVMAKKEELLKRASQKVQRLDGTDEAGLIPQDKVIEGLIAFSADTKRRDEVFLVQAQRIAELERECGELRGMLRSKEESLRFITTELLEWRREARRRPRWFWEKPRKDENTGV
jgi:hypothetical protein